MRLWVFELILFIFAVLGLASFFGLFFSYDPFTAGAGIIILTYLTLFFGLTGIFSLAGFLARKLRKSKKARFDEATARRESAQDLIRSFWWGFGVSLCVVVFLAVMANI